MLVASFFNYKYDKNKKKYFLIIFVSSNLLAFSQNQEANIWFVGDKKIDFNTIPPTITPQITPYLGSARSSSICNETGDLLFCVNNSKTLFDKNFQELPNGQDIDYNRPPVFLQLPETPNIYYFINNNKYNIIDITLNNGNGDVILKNQAWNNLNFKRIYVIHHANCIDYWLSALNDTSFCSYLITKNGISDQPVVTHSSYYLEFEGSISIDGSRYIAYISNGGHTLGFEYGTFNRATGEFNQLSINLESGLYNLNSCFSPDNTKFYFVKGVAGHRYLYQVDIQNDIPDFANKIEIQKEMQNMSTWGRMQIGNDGKIYECNSIHRRVNIIHNPNVLGLPCNFQLNAISLNKAGIIPQFISTWSSLLTCELDFNYLNDCTLITSFTINNAENIQSVLWDFGDGQTSPDLEPTHTYANAGTYNVTLSVTYNDNSNNTVNKEITIYEKPTQIIIFHN